MTCFRGREGEETRRGQTCECNRERERERQICEKAGPDWSVLPVGGHTAGYRGTSAYNLNTAGHVCLQSFHAHSSFIDREIWSYTCESTGPGSVYSTSHVSTVAVYEIWWSFHHCFGGNWVKKWNLFSGIMKRSMRNLKLVDFWHFLPFPILILTLEAYLVGGTKKLMKYECITKKSYCILVNLQLQHHKCKACIK